MGVQVKTTSVTHGIRCDVQSCTALLAAEPPIPGNEWSQPVREFLHGAHRDGWSRRASRSVRWYCPEHEVNAYACNDRYCAVEGKHDISAHASYDGQRSVSSPNVIGRAFRESTDSTKEADRES